MKKEIILITGEVANDLTNITSALLAIDGKEVNNPKPLMTQFDLEKSVSLKDRVQALFRGELSRRAAQLGYETEEDANDFDIDDGFETNDPNTIYQVLDDEVPVMTNEPPSLSGESEAITGEAGISEPEANEA